MNIGIDGGLDLRMSQALLHIAGIPPGTNEFGGMTVAQQVSMQGNATFPAVMAKQAFEGLSTKGMAVGGYAPRIPGVWFEDDEEMIRLEGVLKQ